MPTTHFARQQHISPFGQEAGELYDVPYSHQSDDHLYIISEHDYIRSLIPSAVLRVKAPRNLHHHHHHHHQPPILSRRIASPTRPLRQTNKPPRPLMATLTYTADAHMAAPGSPPDLTNSKSSKSSSFHSSGLPDGMGHSDISHFEDINLDDIHGGPSSFHIPPSPSNRVLFEASRHVYPSSKTSHRSASQAHAPLHSFRDLTGNSRPRHPSLKGQVHNAIISQSQLNVAGRSVRRGFSSPSAPSLANASLTAPTRRSRSPSPSNLQSKPSSSPTRSLSPRSSTRRLSPAPSVGDNRRQSWQHTVRKTAKEREAECDDEDDELPDDAIIWNVPISPRPAQERSPAPSTCGSPPQSVYSPANSRPVSLRGDSSSKTSPTIPARHFSPGPLSPNLPTKENVPPAQGLVRQSTNTWETTYTGLDEDAKKVTEALEEYQTELESQQEIKRQLPSLSRSPSIEKPEPKSRTRSLPPLRKSDPLIDPLQPSAEKQKYLSRTRPSWLPPKDRKEEKKHLKEYQRMLARIEEADRLETQRQEAEAIAREQAERVKADYWNTLLLPNWATEMSNPESKGTHRKMWWNGIPNKLRGTIWQRAIGNDLEITENTFNIALEKANSQIKQVGEDAAFDGKVKTMIDNTRNVFPSLKMFAPASKSDEQGIEETEAQPLHQDLVDVCLAYSSYRSDVDTTAGVHHIAGLFLLNMSVHDTFSTICNLLNRALPLSFLVRDVNAMSNAYSTTLSALDKKCPMLATRLAEIRVEPRDYMDDMYSSLFCSRLSVDHAARIMDVYSIEGDKIGPRVMLGMLVYLEGSCYQGGVPEALDVLKEKKITESPDEFMGRVYEAGKISST
ncbi:hypothetical protein K504DRAFT_466718 [Pleomassaria siparia CBS 279.74]|uniref:Rab-GAP TBC domain-containing protein n=1 Tax=Pleomassaria siparia CBS 279.74 TaxID=1314801 RepID=A0A6G1KBV9_9PLEO|nr:hypothetical protein K504DRAFT_466718 [Pleomassaria siparia CBS 279.74]